ncbi:MAG: hypothetical protein HC887_08645 [Desulfobacteraceae bacterium]|nr:hypothetical protein [Desulfobacteraceae bacterium]
MEINAEDRPGLLYDILRVFEASGMQVSGAYIATYGQRVVDVFLSFDTELKKIVAPLGRSTSLPIGMSDALGIGHFNAAERLGINYVV